MGRAVPRAKDAPWKTSVSQGNRKPLWGVDGESLYFDSSLSWVWIDGEDVVIDTDASNGVAVADGDEAVID